MPRPGEGACMTEQHPIPLAGERFGTPDSIEVVNPFDGSTVGRVPKCTAAEVDRAVAAARAAMDDTPITAYERAEVLDRAAVLLRERHEDFARTIAVEAAK